MNREFYIGQEVILFSHGELRGRVVATTDGLTSGLILIEQEHGHGLLWRTAKECKWMQPDPNRKLCGTCGQIDETTTLYEGLEGLPYHWCDKCAEGILQSLEEQPNPHAEIKRLRTLLERAEGKFRGRVIRTPDYSVRIRSKDEFMRDNNIPSDPELGFD